jgi:hypothetical protein
MVKTDEHGQYEVTHTTMPEEMHPAKLSIPKPTPKPKPIAAANTARAPHVLSEKAVPNLWDELYQVGNKAPSGKRLASVEIHKEAHGLEFLGYLNFIIATLYFFLYVYFTSNLVTVSASSWVYQAYDYLTKAHALAIGTGVVGVLVFIKNKTLGFLLILLGVSLYFDLQAVAWTYFIQKKP